MTTIEKIQNLLTQHNISVYKLSKEIGLNKTFLTNWTSGKAKPSADALTKIADYFHISVDYLLGRTDTMTPFPNPNELPQNYIPQSAISMSLKRYSIPIIGTVKAGVNGYAAQDIEGYEVVTDDDINSQELSDYFWLRVYGDSMEPELNEGDLVLIHKQSSVDSGTLAVVLVDEEEGLIKYVEYGRDWIELISENENYAPRRFEKDEVLRVYVVGEVIQSKRFHKKRHRRT